MFQRSLAFAGVLMGCLGFAVTPALAKDSVVGVSSLPTQPTQTAQVWKPKHSFKSVPPPASSTSTATPAATSTSAPATPDKVEEPKKIAGYDKGFFIQSPDGKYRLNINGYLQGLFGYDRQGGENAVGFRVQNARITFSGHLATKKLTYKLQLNLVKFKDELLLDAWMDYRFMEAVGIRFGQQDIPWIRQTIISSSNLEFVDRSLATIEFLNAQDVDSDKDGIADKQTRNGRDMGLVVQGTPFNKKMEYNIGLFNGSGTNTTNFNNHLLYTARAVYNIMGDFGYEEGDYSFSETPQAFFGGSGNYNVRDFTDRKITQLGAETGLKYKGFSAQGEFFFRNSSPGTTTLGTTNDFGYYAQVGYFAVPKHLEVAARASQVFLEGLQNDKSEFMLGLTGYPLNTKVLRMQTDYSVLPENTKDGLETSQRLRVQVQTKF